MSSGFEDLRRLSGAIARAEHGTRTCYVGQRCRCDACRRANREWYRQRMARRAELVAEVEIRPSGPPGAKLIGGLGGRQGKTCPGANGATCVKGGAWLREGKEVCAACVERVTVWNGLVPAGRARQHLLELSAKGVGYKSVAAASDVAKSVLGAILAGTRTKIRADSERAILAVDESAIADHQSVPLAPTLELIEKIRARGFSRADIAKLLGFKTRALQFGVQADKITARNAAAVERIWRGIERGEVQPPGAFVDSGETYGLLHELVARGLTAKWLSERLGFHVNLSQQPARIRKTNAAAVQALLEEMKQLHREGDSTPEPWESGSSITSAFGFDGGWGWEQRTSKKKAREEAAELKRLARGAA